MDCIAKGYPKPVVSWRRWGNEIVSGTSMEVWNNGTLFIKSFRRSDQGDYECTATNIHGQTLKRVFVESLGKRLRLKSMELLRFNISISKFERDF